MNLLSILTCFHQAYNHHAHAIISTLYRNYEQFDEWQHVKEYLGSGNAALYMVAVFSSVKFLDFGTYCQNLWPDLV